MKKNSAKCVISLILTILSFNVFATKVEVDTTKATNDEISFNVNAPTQVMVGEQFEVTYEMSTNSDKNSITPNVDFSEFAMVLGVGTMTSQGIEITEKGEQEKRIVTSYNYMLIATKEGVFSLPEMKFSLSDNEFTSGKIDITVVKNPNITDADEKSKESNKLVLNDKDLLLRMEVDKTTAKVGESIQAALKLYIRYELGLIGSRSCNIKEASMTNFEVNSFEDNERSGELEEYNGDTYITYILREYTLTPKDKGVLNIGKASVDAILQLAVQSDAGNGMFMFFGPQEAETAEKSLESLEVSIKVTK